MHFRYCVRHEVLFLSVSSYSHVDDHMSYNCASASCPQSEASEAPEMIKLQSAMSLVSAEVAHEQ